MRPACVVACVLSVAVPSGATEDFRTTAELLEIFDVGVTAGGATDELGASTQAECLTAARELNHLTAATSDLPPTTAASYCAVNFYPNGLAGNVVGGGAGRCEAVRSPCKEEPTVGAPGGNVITAPIYLSLEDPRLPNFSPVAPSWGDAVSACAELAAFIHGVWTAGPTTILSRDVSQLDCIASVSNADSPYCAVNFYPNPSGGTDGSGYGIAGRCEGVQPPCEAVFSHARSVVSTAALPVDRGGGCEWTQDTLPSLFEKINAACCAPGQSCEDGPPTACSTECHDIVIGAWGDTVCKEVMLDMLGSTILDFVALCQDPAATAAGGDGGGH